MGLLCNVAQATPHAATPWCLVRSDFVDETGEFDENAYDDFIQTIRHQEQHGQSLSWNGRA